MKLYLKIKRPDGKRFNFLDPVTRMFNYKKVVFLYPEKATEVDKEFAEQLLDRDPHLVSTKPYSKADDPQVMRLAEIKKERAANQVKHNPETTEQRTAANARFKRSTNKHVQPSVDHGLEQKAAEEAVSENIVAALGDDPMQYVEILGEIGEVNKETITIDTIRHFGKLINCKFVKKQGKTKAVLLKQLDARCDALTAKIEKFMNTGPEKYADTETKKSGYPSDLPEAVEEIIEVPEPLEESEK